MELLNFMNAHPDWRELLAAAPYHLDIRSDEIDGIQYFLLKYNQIMSDMGLREVQEARGSIFRQNDVTDENNMAIDIEEGKLSYSNVLSYTGEPVRPKITVTYKGKELNEDFDYVVEFTNNIEPGTATFTVKGIGNYKGELTGSFEIVED